MSAEERKVESKGHLESGGEEGLSCFDFLFDFSSDSLVV